MRPLLSVPRTDIGLTCTSIDMSVFEFGLRRRSRQKVDYQLQVTGWVSCGRAVVLYALHCVRAVVCGTTIAERMYFRVFIFTVMFILT